MMKVNYSSNNSGGSWWLTDENWKALEAAGWDVKWRANETSQFAKADSDGRWLGALATEASKDFETMREAVEEWQNITGQNAADEGCNCCGEPHYFSGEDADGNYVSGPEIRRDSYIEW